MDSNNDHLTNVDETIISNTRDDILLTNDTNIDEFYDKITNGVQEIIPTDFKIKVLSQYFNKINDKPLHFYIGTAPTGRPHIGYLGWLRKVADILSTGCNVTILLADLHAYLDSKKTPWELLGARCRFYEKLISTVLLALGCKHKPRFVRGSSFQLTGAYTVDVYRALATTTLRNAQKAGSEVVKQSNNPIMSSLVYPILQCLDMHYLNADVEIGGVDQRKIMMLGEEILPALGYTQKHSYLLCPMIPSFEKPLSDNGNCNKMSSSSQTNQKIDLLDDPTTICAKLKKAFMADGSPNCGLMTFIRLVVFPQLGPTAFVIEREEKYGGTVEFLTADALCDAITNKTVGAIDVKQAVATFLIKLLESVRTEFSSDEGKKMVDECCYGISV